MAEALRGILASEIVCPPPPEFPKVVKRKKKLFLELGNERWYEIPSDLIKVLGLLHHLAGKLYTAREFYFYAIPRIAEARGWKIHPIC